MIYYAGGNSKQIEPKKAHLLRAENRADLRDTRQVFFFFFIIIIILIIPPLIERYTMQEECRRNFQREHNGRGRTFSERKTGPISKTRTSSSFSSVSSYQYAYCYSCYKICRRSAGATSKENRTEEGAPSLSGRPGRSRRLAPILLLLFQVRVNPFTQ